MSSIAVTDDVLENVPLPSRMTEEEFVDWSERHEKVRAEWLDGEVLFMSPVSVRHVRIFVWLQSILGVFVQERRLGEVLGAEFSIRLQNGGRISRRTPDLMLVRTSRLDIVRENHLEGPPDLAVEIVSSESTTRDWTDKLVEYEAGGIQEYWIIDPLTKRFEAFSLSSQGKYTSISDPPAGKFTSQIVDGFEIQIEWLWSESLPHVLDVLRGLNVIH